MLFWLCQETVLAFLTTFQFWIQDCVRLISANNEANPTAHRILPNTFSAESFFPTSFFQPLYLLGTNGVLTILAFCDHPRRPKLVWISWLDQLTTIFNKQIWGVLFRVSNSQDLRVCEITTLRHRPSLVYRNVSLALVMATLLLINTSFRNRWLSRANSLAHPPTLWSYLQRQAWFLADHRSSPQQFDKSGNIWWLIVI